MASSQLILEGAGASAVRKLPKDVLGGIFSYLCERKAEEWHWYYLAVTDWDTQSITLVAKQLFCLRLYVLAEPCSDFQSRVLTKTRFTQVSTFLFEYYRL